MGVRVRAGLTFMSRSGEEGPLPLMAPALHVTHSQNTREAGGGRRRTTGREARARRRGRSVCTEPARLPTSPHRTTRAPTATVLVSHYNLRAACFLPLLLPRFVLRIIECIPLAPPPCERAPAQIIAACNYVVAAHRAPRGTSSDI